MIDANCTPRRPSSPAAWVEDAARDHPQQLFLRTEAGRQLTYAALRGLSGRFASALHGLGVVPGERVAVQADKSVEVVLLYVACLRMGAVFVPINVANTPNEVEYFLSDSRPRVAVVRPADRAALEVPAGAAGVRHVLTLGAHGDGSLPELALQAADDFEPLQTEAGDSLAAIVYTSGTTGRSKGAMLTRANLASNAAVLAEAWRFSRRDVLLHVLPLFHVHGLFAAVNTVLASASSLLLLPNFDPALTVKLLSHATVFMGVPTHYTRLLQQSALNRETAAAMRLFVSGSAPLLADTHQEFLLRTGHRILERYGMTETLMNTSNPYDGVRVPGSVGPALPGISIRVAIPNADPGANLNANVTATLNANVTATLNADATATLNADATATLNADANAHASAAPAFTVSAGLYPGPAADAVGALEVSGPNVFAGYWHDPDKTRAEFTADGWFKTGDLGRIDRDGYVYIVGRAKDLVISGGYNVYPKEVETELDALPGVLESAVFGLAHADLGEGVTAAVVCRPAAALTEALIIEALKMRLARYKVPKRIVFVEELPRNTMGKVQKSALRAAYASLYG